MRSTINIEFTDEELRKHAEDLGRRLIVHLLSHIGETISELDPQGLNTVMQYMTHMVQTGVQFGTRYTQQQHQHHHHHRHGHGGPPPYPTTGPVTAGPYGGGTYGPPPDNVRPMRESAELKHCFSIEATRHGEAGWGCCRCATYNGLARAACRHCGHTRCDMTTTPPRDHEPPRVPSPHQPEPAS